MLNELNRYPDSSKQEKPRETIPPSRETMPQKVVAARQPRQRLE